MRISFIGLGKLGMPCAEALAKKGYTDIAGYDVLQKHSDLVDIKSSLADAIKNRDVVSVMLPNVPEMIETHFGVPMSGAILNSLNTF